MMGCSLFFCCMDAFCVNNQGFFRQVKISFIKLGLICFSLLTLKSLKVEMLFFIFKK